MIEVFGTCACRGSKFITTAHHHQLTPRFSLLNVAFIDAIDEKPRDTATAVVEVRSVVKHILEWALVDGDDHPRAGE